MRENILNTKQLYLSNIQHINVINVKIATLVIPLK